MFEYANSSKLTACRSGVESIVSSALPQRIDDQVSQSHAGFFQLKLDHRFCLPLSFISQESKAPVYQLFIN